MSAQRSAVVALGIALAVVCHAPRARAQSLASSPPQPSRCSEHSVCASREPVYFIGHGSILGLTALGTVIAGNAFPESPPRVRSTASSARGVAAATLSLDLVLPVAGTLTAMQSTESFDAMLTYGQAIFGAQFLDHLVLRPLHLDSQTTLAFAGAVTGAYLFDQADNADPKVNLNVNLGVRSAFWGVELGLATATARLQTRAGDSDFWSAAAGVGLGTGIGLLLQSGHSHFTQHGLEPSWIKIYRDPKRHGDYRDAMWIYPVAGILAGYFLPFAAPKATADPNLKYEVTPYATPQGAGLVLHGNLD